MSATEFEKSKIVIFSSDGLTCHSVITGHVTVSDTDSHTALATCPTGANTAFVYSL